LNRRTVELISEQFPELVERRGKLELKGEEERDEKRAMSSELEELVKSVRSTKSVVRK
jgi:hypothetical protein